MINWVLRSPGGQGVDRPPPPRARVARHPEALSALGTTANKPSITRDNPSFWRSGGSPVARRAVFHSVSCRVLSTCRRPRRRRRRRRASPVCDRVTDVRRVAIDADAVSAGEHTSPPAQLPLTPRRRDTPRHGPVGVDLSCFRSWIPFWSATHFYRCRQCQPTRHQCQRHHLQCHRQCHRQRHRHQCPVSPLSSP